MFSYISAFTVFALYMSVGVYHVWRMGGRPRSSRHVLVSFGAIWLTLGTAYLWIGLSQLFYALGDEALSRELFHLNYCNALAVIVPYYYFASYLLWGDRRLSRVALAAGVMVLAGGIGLAFTTPVDLRVFGWGSTWDFLSKRVIIYYQLLGALPVGASLAAFLLYLYPRSLSPRARRRLLLTTLSFGLLLAGWAILVTRSSPALFISRLLALASGVTAHIAYFPPGPPRGGSGG